MEYPWLEFYSRVSKLVGFLILLGGGIATLSFALQADDGAEAVIVLALGVPMTGLWALTPMAIGEAVDVVLNVASDVAEIADRGYRGD